MKVTQTDSRSIRIISDSGMKVFLPYLFFWNGHERAAESIVLTSPEDGANPESGVHEVRAFFLFGEIRDRITEDAAGIVVSRRWSVRTTGSGHLSIDADFDLPPDSSCLFPGLYSAPGLPSAPISFLGEKTAYPSSLFLSTGKKGVLLFSPSAVCGHSPGSVGISRIEVEDSPARLRVKVRFPGIEEPAGRVGPKPGDVQPAEDSLLESTGSIEMSQDLCLAFSSREEIVVRGAAAVVQRVARVQTTSSVPVDPGALADELHKTLGTHLHEAGGVAGLKETSDGSWISASAGLGCALALLKLFPEDALLSERALRFADFALKGQVPWGVFHESYHIATGRWRGVRGKEAGSILSVGQSARIAELLLALSDELARLGRPHEKYFLAGLRFVDFLLDEKGRLSLPGELHVPSSSSVSTDAVAGLGGLDAFFPVSLVFAKTGHDRYKKAMDVLVRRFSGLDWDPFHPPSTRSGRGPDSAGALLASRLYVEMRARGYKPVQPPVSGAAAVRARAAESARLFASLLVPWIRIHAEQRGQAGRASRTGFLLDSFERQRLLCAGRETALLLLRLAQLIPFETEKILLMTLARDCMAAAQCTSAGTSFIQHTSWDASGLKKKPGTNPVGRVGPIDSRRVATEVLAGLRIAEEFPSGDSGLT
jgi:hypothetical protein